MYSEDDLRPLSALQHLLFCPRQCALIHIEQVWDENRLTAEGRVMHERVHEAGEESRGDVRTVRGLWVRSLRLGLVGKADVVEFHREGVDSWKPFPVEFKLGKPKPVECDRVQLCAQALCLEELLDRRVGSGAIFYGRTRRRLAVDFDAELRNETEKTVERLHQLIQTGITPAPDFSKKCGSCSLVELCLPKAIRRSVSVAGYLARMLEEGGD